MARAIFVRRLSRLALNSSTKTLFSTESVMVSCCLKCYLIAVHLHWLDAIERQEIVAAVVKI